MLQLADLTTAAKEKHSELALEQEGREKVRLQMEFALVQKIDQGPFWERAELIAQAIDFVQAFCSRQKDKTVIVALNKLVLGNALGRTDG